MFIGRVAGNSCLNAQSGSDDRPHTLFIVEPLRVDEKKKGFSQANGTIVCRY